MFGAVCKMVGGLVLGIFGLAFIAGLVGASSSKQATTAESAERVRISSFSTNRTGFGSILEASFYLTNEGDNPAKDIEVTCSGYASSGTLIDTNTRTIYQRIGAHQSLSVPNFNMGFINSQVSSFRCGVVRSAQAA